MWLQLITDIVDVINNGAYINITINNNISKIKDSEKKLYTKIIYGVVENKAWLDFLLRPYVKNGRFKPFLKNALRIGVYAFSFLSLAPFYIVNVLVETVKKKDYHGSKALNSILRKFLQDNRVLHASEELNNLSDLERESIIYNLDKEIVKLIKTQYPKEYNEILLPVSFPYNTYRINYLKTTNEEVCSFLNANHINYEIKDEALICKESLINTSIFENNLIIAQDISSIQVSKILNPHEGSSILDVCSAPGSKSFHLATILNNKGEITSCDIYEHKLKLIEKKAQDLGIKIIKTALKDATSATYDKLYDYILVDAPCSGMGTMKHKCDLKLKLNLQKIKEIESIQEKILINVVNYLKNDGILVYSTCTININENHLQIMKFLKNHPNIKMIYEEQILPTDHFDGFYICKLKRKDI